MSTLNTVDPIIDYTWSICSTAFYLHTMQKVSMEQILTKLTTEYTPTRSI